MLSPQSFFCCGCLFIGLPKSSCCQGNTGIRLQITKIRPSTPLSVWHRLTWEHSTLGESIKKLQYKWSHKSLVLKSKSSVEVESACRLCVCLAKWNMLFLSPLCPVKHEDSCLARVKCRRCSAICQSALHVPRRCNKSVLEDQAEILRLEFVIMGLMKPDSQHAFLWACTISFFSFLTPMPIMLSSTSLNGLLKATLMSTLQDRSADLGGCFQHFWIVC